MLSSTAASAVTAASAGLSRSGTPGRAGVIVNSVRKSRQHIGRKELQQRAKQEYLRRIYEAADQVEDDHLVFELQPSSPRMRSQLQQSEQHAAFNRQLAQQIPQLTTWPQLQQCLQQHGDTLNFLNVVALVTRAAELLQQDDAPAPPMSAAINASAANQALGVPQAPTAASSDAAAVEAADSTAAPAYPSLAMQLAVLVLQQSSWFQPTHFAASAAALSALGVTDEAVWYNLTAAAEHKVGGFTFTQLAVTLDALAAAGCTPGLSWIERTYRQASKHIHAADPADICVLMGAWGEMGYTPRDRLFMNQVKILTRRAFDRKQLSGPELVQLMHGVARMPRYAPNQGWLAALAKATRHHLQDLTPGAVVDLLLSFAALNFTPAERWMEAALARLQDAMCCIIDQSRKASTSEASTGEASTSSTISRSMWSSQQQQEEAGQLILPPLDLQQLQRDQQLQEPGLLQAASQQNNNQQQQQPQESPVEVTELQELQDLFDEAEEEGEEDGQAADGSLQPAASLARQPQHQPGAIDAAQQQEELEPSQAAEEAVFAARLRSSSSSSCDSLSLRRQLLQPQLTLEHLGVLCWCLGRLQFQPRRGWMQLLGQVLMRHVPAMPPDVLIDVLLGCVAVGHLPIGRLQEQLLLRVLQCTPSMPPEALRRTCQALAALEAGLLQYEQHPAALAAALRQQAGAEGPAMSVNISAHLHQHRVEIAAAVVQRQGVIITSSSTAQLADVMAFAAAAGQTPSLDYMTAAVTRAVNKLPDGCPTPAVCTLLWALARMGFKPHPELLHQLLAVLQKGLHLLSSQHLADAGWALCTLRHRPGSTWLSLYLKEVAAKARYMQAQALTDTLWALACFAAQPDREWLKQVVQAVGHQVASGALSQQNAAVVVWALQQLGFQPGIMLEAAPASAGVQDAAAAPPQPLGGVQSAMLSLVQLVQA